MKKWFVIIACFAAAFLNAQDNTIDSLKTELNSATNDTTRCNILSTMVEAESNDELWRGYNEQMLILAEKNLESTKDPKLVKFFSVKRGMAYVNRGYYYEHVKVDMKLALEDYKKAVEYLEPLEYIDGLATAYNNLGSVYEKTGDIKNAIRNYEISLKFKEQGNNKKSIALTLNNIGMVFFRQKEYKDAIKYFIRSINLGKELKDGRTVAYVSNNLGLTYRNMNNNLVAEAYFKRAIMYWQQIKNEQALSYVYNNLGSVYQEMKRYGEAKEILAKSNEIATRLGDKHVQAYSKLNFARIAVIEKDIATAETDGLEALKLSKELAFPDNIRDATFLLSDVYEKKKNYARALEMYEEHIKMKDSIINEESKNASIRSDLKYEFEKKAAADSVKVMQEKKLGIAQLEQEETQRTVLYAGLALVGVFALFMLNRYRVIRKQKEIINDQKKIVEEQKSIVEEKQKEIMDSIHYAKRIQLSHLPTDNYLDKNFRRLKNYLSA